MLLVQKLIVAIEEGEDGRERVRWLLEDGGRKFANFREQLSSVNFDEVDPTANAFKPFCLWAAIEGDASLLQTLLSKLVDEPMEGLFEKTELAEKCFDFSCRFDRVNCAQVAYFACGNRKIDDMRVRYEKPLVYAAEGRNKAGFKFRLFTREMKLPRL